MSNTTQKFLIVFGDGFRKESDRFTIAATFQGRVSEDAKGCLHYVGTSPRNSFTAYPIAGGC